MPDDVRQYFATGEQVGSRYQLVLPQRAGLRQGGGRLGNRAGRSIDFKDYRDYQLGDDLRWIDWGIYGRTDRLIVKLFHEDVCPHLDLVIDTSGSMALAGSAKQQASCVLAAALGAAAANTHCSCCAWTAGESVHELNPAPLSPSIWNVPDFSAASSVGEAFARRTRPFKRQSIRVLISDLMFADDPRSVVQPLAQNASAVFVLQVLGEEERNPAERGNIRLQDAETGETLELFMDATAQKRYRDNLQEHISTWHAACREVGAAFISLTAEELAADWNLRLLAQIALLEVV